MSSETNLILSSCSYIMEVLAEEAVTFLIMEQENCDYETATGRALGHDQPLNTLYHDNWFEILPGVRVPSMADVEARKEYDLKVKAFVENTPETIKFIDVPWPCNGAAEDLVAVMLSGEDSATKRKRIKDLILFWHPDKFFSRFKTKLSQKDRELIIDSVLDISKELSRVLEGVR